MQLPKETRFYYLDYLQKQINKLVRRNNIPMATLDQMLFMIDQLKKEDEESKVETQEGKFLPNFHD